MAKIDVPDPASVQKIDQLPERMPLHKPSAWAPHIELLVASPRTWHRIAAYETATGASQASSGLKAASQKYPGNFEFSTRSNTVYGRYLGEQVS